MLIWVIITVIFSSSSVSVLWATWGSALQQPGEHIYKQNWCEASQNENHKHLKDFSHILLCSSQDQRALIAFQLLFQAIPTEDRKKNPSRSTICCRQKPFPENSIKRRGSLTCRKLAPEDRRAEGAVADKMEAVFLYQPNKEHRTEKRADVENYKAFFYGQYRNKDIIWPNNCVSTVACLTQTLSG